jgi:hypothetical protein
VAIDLGAPWSDVRLIAELKRDTIGKARYIQRRKAQLVDVSLIEGGLYDDVIAKIAPMEGCLGILEWTGTGSDLFGLLTTIDSAGRVVTAPITATELDIHDLKSKIAHRLSVWHPGRKGDPFDLPEWRLFETWLHGEIVKRLPKGSHVIVIEDQSLIGIPWHVALSPGWCCSYCPGWAMILEGGAIPSQTSPRLGVFAAPRYLDSTTVKDAIAASVRSTRRWTSWQGYGCMVFENEAADKEGFERLMAECDAVKLLCHGYVSPEDNEIALLVSHGGALPPMHAPGRAEVPDEHRLSWRDLQSLPKAPPLILSCACSSALQWRAGSGEQMGLLGALWHSGTRTFIGPRWDVVAEDVLPLLDDVLFRIFTSNTSLVQSLHQACLEAEKKMPRWLAWSISLEGGWA